MKPLSPKDAFVLRLIIGVAVLVAASWMFGDLAEDFVTGDSSIQTDKNVAAWFQHHSTPGMTGVMKAVTFFGSLYWIASGVLVTLAILWRKGLRYRILAFALAVPGGMYLVPLLKLAFHRLRPHAGDPAFAFDGFSFPSGHTTAATLFYGALALFAASSLEQRCWKIAAVAGAAVLVAAVGFSRIYLGAHYLSDILAAAASGVAWLALCFTSVETLQHRRR